MPCHWGGGLPFLDLGDFALEQIVDHRARQDLVLATDGEPQKIFQTVRKHTLLVTTEREMKPRELISSGPTGLSCTGGSSVSICENPGWWESGTG